MAAQPDISERLGFLQLDRDAAQALREIAPLVSQALPGILAEFYVHMRKWPQVAAHFSGEPMMDKAKNKQLAHWAIILQGDEWTRDRRRCWVWLWNNISITLGKVICIVLCIVHTYIHFIVRWAR